MLFISVFDLFASTCAQIYIPARACLCAGIAGIAGMRGYILSRSSVNVTRIVSDISHALAETIPADTRITGNSSPRCSAEPPDLLFRVFVLLAKYLDPADGPVLVPAQPVAEFSRI
jgi:hypothetical protein